MPLLVEKSLKYMFIVIFQIQINCQSIDFMQNFSKLCKFKYIQGLHWSEVYDQTLHPTQSI